jgi:DMSO/TMAO reductase YedYZ molybdopterin-dependent catalytic subunit
LVLGESFAVTTRRALLQAAGSLAVLGSDLPRTIGAALPAGALESQRLEAIAGKRPLIRRSARPPNYESPLSCLDTPLTPNDCFFVRWHHAGIEPIDARAWRLKVAGEAAQGSLELSLAQLRHDFAPVEVIAVCQCAGNQRGLALPHVPGVEWGPGAVGNARWKGVRLKEILARVQPKKEALEIAFEGADTPVFPQSPKFMKSLPLSKALDDNTLLAYEMNGASLPHWNGFPVRLVVPGWAGTYWVKQLTTVSVLSRPLASFWMSTAYRVPKGKYPVGDRFPSQESEASTPLMELDLNSVITNIKEGEQFHAGRSVDIQGVAWDSGTGIKQVEISSDQGSTWMPATLGKDLGRYSFRTWRLSYRPPVRGSLTLMTRATNAQGAVQPSSWVPNPAGYHNNIIQKLAINIV